MSVRTTCAGCLNIFSRSVTSEYRKKTWCGAEECREAIDVKVKHKNYLRKQKKIKNGTWRVGVDQEYRALILDRDGNKCVRCGIFSEELGAMQVHHIIPVSESGTDDATNLITLCKHCHTKIHQIGWEVYSESFQQIAKDMEKKLETERG